MTYASKILIFEIVGYASSNIIVKILTYLPIWRIYNFVRMINSKLKKNVRDFYNLIAVAFCNNFSRSEDGESKNL